MTVSLYPIEHTDRQITLKLVTSTAPDIKIINTQDFITLSDTGSVTFVSSTSSMTRTIGSWIGDGVVRGMVISLTSDDTTLNIGDFVVRSVTATEVFFETIEGSGRKDVVDEVLPLGIANSSCYTSVFLKYGQVLTLPIRLLITKVKTSLFLNSSVGISRGATQFRIVGVDSVEYSAPQSLGSAIVVNFIDGEGSVVIEVSKQSLEATGIANS